MSEPKEPPKPNQEPPLTLAQQQEGKLAEEFYSKYQKLVKEYGLDFQPQTQIVIVKVDPNQNVNSNSNLNPLGIPSKPAK